MRLSQLCQCFAALFILLTFPQILAVPINTDSTDSTTPLVDGQVTPPDQVGGSPSSHLTPPGAPLKAGKNTSYQIARDLADWIRSQGENGWCHIPAEAGGCEIWAQVGFTNFIKNKYRIPPSTRIREQHVYLNSAQAADFTIPPNIDSNGKPLTRGIIVELKVESKSQKGAALVDLVKKDREKLEGGVKEEYKDYDKAVLAIAWTKPTKQALTKDGGMLAHHNSLVHLAATKGKNGKLTPAMDVGLFEYESDTSHEPDIDSLSLSLGKNLRVGE